MQTSAAAIAAELDLGTLLDLIVQEATRTFNAPAASLLLLDPVEDVLRIKANRGLSAQFVSQLIVQRAQLGETTTATGYARVGPPQLIADIQAEVLPEAQRRLFAEEDVCSLLRVPIVSRGRLVGALEVYSRSVPRRFREDEIDLAEIFTSQAAVAIENAQLLEETRRRLAEISILFEASRAGASTLDLGQVLDRVLEVIKRSLRFDTLEFILYEPDKQLLQTRAGYGYPT